MSSRDERGAKDTNTVAVLTMFPIESVVNTLTTDAPLLHQIQVMSTPNQQPECNYIP